MLHRLSSRLILDKDSVIEHLHSRINEMAEVESGHLKVISSLQDEVSELKVRMTKYPSLFIKKRVYWLADPEANGRSTAYCPDCWNDRHILSPLEKAPGATIGVCEKHSPPLRF
jgi:hypothetical protein